MIQSVESGEDGSVGQDASALDHRCGPGAKSDAFGFICCEPSVQKTVDVVGSVNGIDRLKGKLLGGFMELDRGVGTDFVSDELIPISRKPCVRREAFGVDG